MPPQLDPCPGCTAGECGFWSREGLIPGPQPQLLAPHMQIPEAWLLLANVVTVLLLVPLKDHLLDPLLLRCRLLPSALQKMALGMFFGFASVIIAGMWPGRDLVLRWGPCHGLIVATYGWQPWPGSGTS